MSDVLTAPVPRRSPVQRRPGPPAKLRPPSRTPSPKVKAAIERMIFGSTVDAPVTRQDAAKAVGLSDETLRAAFRNPVVMKYYREQLDVLRTSEQPRSVQRIAHLRDKAGSERVQLDAAKYLDGGDKGSGITVNVGIQNLQPGYAIAVPQDYADGARQMLKLSGSHANVLDLQADVPTDEPGTR